MTIHVKLYCLRCYRPGMGCKCVNKDMQIAHAHKLRPPNTVHNRAKFRQFLDDCPTFVNMVPPHLEARFIRLLREVKYFGRCLNGRSFTTIEK